MKLNLDQVKKVASLANLPITDKEAAIYSDQLSEVLDYVEQLEKVDNKDEEALFNITPNKNCTRDDFVSNTLTQDEALSNSPLTKDGFFVTKGVFTDE